MRATGLNTTTKQVGWLHEEIARRRLWDRLEAREADFRDVDRRYDKVVSIGLLEHAGRDQLFEVVKAHAEFLKPGGLGMLHFIGRIGQYETEFYIRDHVFPGCWIPRLTEALDACVLEILDIENLRRHYVPTLEAWAQRFDANWERIHALNPVRFDERFRRIWRTYLLGCAEMFRASNGFYLREIGILPLWICPVGAVPDADRFPLFPRQKRLYVNFGFWDVKRTREPHPAGHFNRMIERQVVALGGTKSLYSDSYFERDEFVRLYGGEAYRALKTRYDPAGRLGDLYAKCVLRQ